MSSFEQLLEAISRHDVARFLREYLVLVQNKVTLSLPQQLKQEDVEAEWQELVPIECKQASELFFSELAQLWLRLLASVPKEASQDTLQELLNAIDRASSVKMDAPRLASQGKIRSVISQTYRRSNKMFSQLSLAEIQQKTREGVKRKNERQFLLYYVMQCRLKETHSLPQCLDLAAITAGWKTILVQEFQQSSKAFLEAVAQLYYSCVHVVGLPVSKEQLDHYCEKLIRK